MKPSILWTTLAAGFLVRLAAFFLIDFSFDNDVFTFQMWAIRVFEYGFAEFYVGDTFTDYPPVYMYVLYLVGWAQSVFRWSPLNIWFNFVTFLPAIICDLLIGYVLGRKFYSHASVRGKFSFLCIAAWIFNPAVILISSIWGQVESVFSLMLLLSLILLRQKRLLPAYVLFGLAIVTKPQSLFLGPVYLYSAFEFLKNPMIYERFRFEKFRTSSVFSKKQNHESIDTSIIERVWLFVFAAAAGVGAIVLVSLPFGLELTIRQIFFGMDLYQFASVNAFNFWALVGGNWQPLYLTFLGISYGIWGIGIVLVIIGGSLFALHVDAARHGGQHFYLIAAFLFVIIFVFSVRMHERYLFPGLLFLLVYGIDRRNYRLIHAVTGTDSVVKPHAYRIIWGFYAAFSVTYFVNCFEILRWLRSGLNVGVFAGSLQVVSFINVVLGCMMIIFLCISIRRAGS